MDIDITKIFEFEAAHFLPGHKGGCGSDHGHSYKLEVTVTNPLGLNPSGELKSPYRGMIMDFGDLKKIVQKNIIDIFDHTHLNNLFFLPTAEVMACFIFETLKCCLPKGIKIKKIKLWETSTSYATATETAIRAS